MLRYAVIVLIALVCRGDLARGTHYAPQMVSLQSIFSARLSGTNLLWLSLWADGWGVARAELTEPASPRFAEIYNDVLADARALGFQFSAPELMQTTSLAAKMIPLPPLVFFARHFMGPNRIQVNTEYAMLMSDGELRVLLAHELGHAIDAQTERMGHPLFVGAEHLSIQFFADYIARLIAGNARVDAFNAKYGIDFTGP